MFDLDYILELDDRSNHKFLCLWKDGSKSWSARPIMEAQFPDQVRAFQRWRCPRDYPVFEGYITMEDREARTLEWQELERHRQMQGYPRMIVGDSWDQYGDILYLICFSDGQLKAKPRSWIESNANHLLEQYQKETVYESDVRERREFGTIYMCRYYPKGEMFPVTRNTMIAHGWIEEAPVSMELEDDKPPSLTQPLTTHHSLEECLLMLKKRLEVHNEILS